MKKLEILIHESLNGNNPTWCEHIYFWSRDKVVEDGEEFPSCGGWTLRGTSSMFVQTDKWNFCPICGVSRP